MTASSLKPILVFGALLASISQSVCVAKVQQKTIDRILNQLPRTPIYRSYIKPPDGEQQAVSSVLASSSRYRAILLNTFWLSSISHYITSSRHFDSWPSQMHAQMNDWILPLSYQHKPVHNSHCLLPAIKKCRCGDHHRTKRGNSSPC